MKKFRGGRKQQTEYEQISSVIPEEEQEGLVVAEDGHFTEVIENKEYHNTLQREDLFTWIFVLFFSSLWAVVFYVGWKYGWKYAVVWIIVLSAVSAGCVYMKYYGPLLKLRKYLRKQFHVN